MKTRTLGLDRNTPYGFLAIMLWSTTIAVIRSLSEQLGPLTAAACIYLVGGAASLGMSFFSRNRWIRVRDLPRRYLIGCGALFVLYMFAIYLGIGLATDRHQVLEIGLLNYLWPALTLLFSIPLLNKKPRPSLVPGTLMALFGVFLVLVQTTSISWISFSKNVTSNPLAYFLGLVAGVSWALYSTLTRRWGGPRNDGVVPFFMLATGVLLFFLRPLHPEKTLWSLRAVLEMSFMSLATVTAYVSWDIAMRKGNVVLVAACSYFIPLFSTLVSSLYLQITPGLTLWLGCGLIILGSLISWISIDDPIPVQPAQKNQT
jgi:drug/metabolite transporter (DMT)-like permease